MSTRNHDRYEQDLAPYALGALPPTEAKALEEHLRECPDCQRELAELSMGADALARSVGRVEPPSELRARLVSQVEEESAREARERERIAARAASAPAVVESPGAEPAREGLRERLRRRRSGRARAGGLRPVRPALAVAATGLVALVAGVAGWAIGQGGDTQRRDLAATVDRARLPGATAKVTVDRDGTGDGVVLRLTGLRNMGPERTYETWVERDGELVPGPLFNPTPGGTAVTGITGDPDDIDAVYVTRERAGGSRTPSETPVVSVPVSS